MKEVVLVEKEMKAKLQSKKKLVDYVDYLKNINKVYLKENIEEYADLKEIRERLYEIGITKGYINIISASWGVGKTYMAKEFAEKHREKERILIFGDNYDFLRKEYKAELSDVLLYYSPLSNYEKAPESCLCFDELLKATNSGVSINLFCSTCKHRRGCKYQRMLKDLKEADIVLAVYDYVDFLLKQFKPTVIIIDEEIRRGQWIRRPKTDIDKIEHHKAKFLYEMEKKEKEKLEYYKKKGNYSKVKKIEDKRYRRKHAFDCINEATYLLRRAKEVSTECSPLDVDFMAVLVKIDDFLSKFDKGKTKYLIQSYLKDLIKERNYKTAGYICKIFTALRKYRDFLLYRMIYYDSEVREYYQPYLFNIFNYYIEHIYNDTTIVFLNANLDLEIFEAHVNIFNFESLGKLILTPDEIKTNKKLTLNELDFIINKLVLKNKATVVYRLTTKIKGKNSWYPQESIKYLNEKGLLLERAETIRVAFGLSKKQLGVVSYKTVESTFKRAGYKFLHFGNLRGQNDLRRCEVLIVFGTYNPNEEAMRDYYKKILKKPFTANWDSPIAKKLSYYLKEREMADAIERARGRLNNKLVFVFGEVPNNIKRDYTYSPREKPKEVVWCDFLLHLKKIADGDILYADYIQEKARERSQRLRGEIKKLESDKSMSSKAKRFINEVKFKEYEW